MNSEPTYEELVQHYSIPGQQPPPEEILRELYARDVAEWELSHSQPVYSARSVAAGTAGAGLVYDPNAPRNLAAGNYEGEGKPLWEDVYGDDENQNRTANYVQGTGMQVYDPNAPSINRAAGTYEDKGMPTYEDYISQEKTFTDSVVDTEEPYTLTQEPYTPTTTPYTPTTVPDDDDIEDDEVPSLPVRNPPRKPYSDPDPFYITYRVPIIILSVLLIIGLILYFYYKNKRSTNLNKPIEQVLASFGKMFNF